MENKTYLKDYMMTAPVPVLEEFLGYQVTATIIKNKEACIDKTLDELSGDEVRGFLAQFVIPEMDEALKKSLEALPESMGQELLEKHGPRRAVYLPAFPYVNEKAMKLAAEFTGLKNDILPKQPSGEDLEQVSVLEVRIRGTVPDTHETSIAEKALKAGTGVLFTRWPEYISINDAASFLKDHFYPEMDMESFITYLQEYWEDYIRNDKERISFSVFIEFLALHAGTDFRLEIPGGWETEDAVAKTLSSPFIQMFINDTDNGWKGRRRLAERFLHDHYGKYPAPHRITEKDMAAAADAFARWMKKHPAITYTAGGGLRVSACCPDRGTLSHKINKTMLKRLMPDILDLALLLPEQEDPYGTLMDDRALEGYLRDCISALKTALEENL